MSYVTNTGDIVPQIITQDLFPFIYSLNDQPLPFVDHDIYPDVYRTYGLPSSLTASIDPAYVTGPQKYEYRYSNQNGIDVVLRGTYDDVMSTVDTLNTYPPLKRKCPESNEREYFELYGPGSVSKKAINVSTVGQINRGKHIYIKMDGKVFSGSGAVIMVVNQSRPLTEAKFILFRASSGGRYAELGGMIDKLQPGTTANRDTLFINAKKEVNEESMELFVLTNPSQVFIDIESTTDDTFYRVYLYLFVINNVNQLPMLYDDNKSEILSNLYGRHGQAYKETDKLALFDYQTFINKLATYNINAYAISSGVFQDTSGNLVSVRGRTMKAIAQFVDKGLITDVINNNKITTASIRNAAPAPGNIFHTINL